MQDQGIGKHCHDSTCRQKDYLPIKCKYCNVYYCADHYSIDSHQCPEYHKQFKQVFTCPMCNKAIPINQNLSVEENFEIHEATECSLVFEEKK